MRLGLNNVFYALLLLFLPHIAQCQSDDSIFFAKINLSHSHINDENKPQSVWQTRSHGSRLGLKSQKVVTEELSFFYHFGWKVDMTGRADKKVKSRDQYVGIKGNWGSFLIGRKNTSLKVSQNKVDLFNSLDGDIKHAFTGDQRLNNTAHYISPAYFGRLQFNMMASAKKNNSHSSAQPSSIAFTYLDQGLFLGLANDINIAGIDNTRLTLQYSLQAMQLGMLWQKSTENYHTSSGYMVSFSYRFEDHKFKVQFAASDTLSKGRELFSLGWDHKLAEATTLYFFYTSRTENAHKKSKHSLG
ncbi:porin [Cognaticolwellia mytili]|uniref:porin n=1 Tax=Cognaticolwellia mytili TaxID=1888913 RepID=UPI000A177ED1|nr:porin [Cognaticolwellia mytili]